MLDLVVNKRGQALPELPPDQRSFSLEEVAGFLGKDHAWVKDRCLMGAITLVRRNGRMRVERYEVLRLLQLYGDAANFFYTLRYVAAIFRDSEASIRKQCRLGNIQFETGYRGSIRIPASEVERLSALLEAQIGASDDDSEL